MKVKQSTKPISSPGRMDNKFPPPLMRFLRTNAGNRSRGRSKSNSMFLILTKKNTTTIETKEPSSPKVTCMGQVRVKRSSISKQPTAKKGLPSTVSGNFSPTKCNRCFWWVPHTLFCFQSVIHPNFACCFRFRRKEKASKVSEASTKNGSKESKRREEEEEEEEKNRVVSNNAFFSSSSSSFCSTPPRNALLLTRCKSAPCSSSSSSSSLANRFWGSPLRSEEKTEQLFEEKQRHSTESVSKLRFFKELEDSIRERIVESERVCKLKRKEEAEGNSVARCLVLKRCKSERTRKTLS
uniref:Uncharacterized protein LOC101492869 n=1 Tax=Cicer arietinum TaxID=3827 RepID=A0A1S2Y1Y8_CICAR|nr:uncharacterized protein LOC101492869 [Cicer arietinum]